MPYNPDRHHRRSIRLKGYDYAQAGAYFVTVCVYQRELLLGDIVEAGIYLNDYGTLTWACWLDLPIHYTCMTLDAFVIMPNHLHGIILLHDDPPVEEKHEQLHYGLSEIVRGFKTYSARRINELRKTPGVPVWQRSYYDHIIRNDEELNAIRDYINNNPARWAEDIDNPIR